MKKFLAMVLCLALVAALGVSAFADTITTGPIFVYEETGKIYRINYGCCSCNERMLEDPRGNSS